MNLLSEIEKDAKQFLREQRTLLLLAAAPVFVLFMLGAIFSNTSAEIGKTTLGVCDLDHSSISKLFVAGLANNTNILDYSNLLYCRDTAEKEVREGRLAAAVLIPAGFQKGIEKGNTQNVTIFIDNSRVQVAPSVEAFMKAAVQETGQKVGVTFISTVWNELDDAAARLDNLTVSIGDTRNRTALMRQRLEQTTVSLRSINTSKIDGEIDAANRTLNISLAYLESADANLTLIEADIADYDSELAQTESDLVQVNDTIGSISVSLNASKAGVNCSDITYAAYCAQIDLLNGRVVSAQQSVSQRLDKVRSGRVKLAQTKITVQSFRQTIAGARSNSADALQRIDNMRQFVSDLEVNRKASLATLADVNSSLDEIDSKTYELENIIGDTKVQIKQITSRPTQFVVSPILLSPSPIFSKRTFFDFLLPSLIPLVIMFISLFLASTSLVREKSSGTMARIAVSQINPFEYAVIKVVSYSVVLLPFALILVLVASLFYGAFPLLDVGAWFFVLQAMMLLVMVFVAAGVLIAIYAESEATAFLASLVIGLPLLFMSGLLFPFEFMPQVVAIIGQASPLTQSVFIMQSVILYHAPQAGGFGILLFYAIVLTLLGGFSLKRSL
ncbi:Chromosome partition protein Smc [uncultured archaeon]|nr:Chromosome partition protein Smc [uncultured archaeon]